MYSTYIHTYVEYTIVSNDPAINYEDPAINSTCVCMCVCVQPPEYHRERSRATHDVPIGGALGARAHRRAAAREHPALELRAARVDRGARARESAARARARSRGTCRVPPLFRALFRVELVLVNSRYSNLLAGAMPID